MIGRLSELDRKRPLVVDKFFGRPLDRLLEPLEGISNLLDYWSDHRPTGLLVRPQSNMKRTIKITIAGETEEDMRQSLLLAVEAAIDTMRKYKWGSGATITGRHGDSKYQFIVREEDETMWQPWGGESADGPVSAERMVLVRLRCGVESARAIEARKVRWTHRPGVSGSDVVEWRLA